MKISYDRKSDILLLETSKQPIDYAEEVDSIIVHFNKKGKPVLLEILDASEFIAKATEVSIKSKDEKPIHLRI